MRRIWGCKHCRRRWIGNAHIIKRCPYCKKKVDNLSALQAELKNKADFTRP